MALQSGDLAPLARPASIRFGGLIPTAGPEADGEGWSLIVRRVRCKANQCRTSDTSGAAVFLQGDEEAIFSGRYEELFSFGMNCGRSTDFEIVARGFRWMNAS